MALTPKEGGYFPQGVNLTTDAENAEREMISDDFAKYPPYNKLRFVRYETQNLAHSD